ncbi:MAG TPA: cytochrome P460 family protein [Polyangiaceae bacterium]|nr:cytochrome P460 family protein [Polyangiaceae bacterium]
MKHFNTWKPRLVIPTALVGALVATGTLFASTKDGPKIPTDFQHGYLVNSMLITKEPNKTGLITGVHLIYVNPVGFDRLKRGGSAAYPDGTVFVDDVREFSVDDGAYHQGPRKFLTVMSKDSKKYASTGGWGFQAWPGGDPAKPIVDDSVKQCFSCHVPEKGNDFVFSTYLQ